MNPQQYESRARTRRATTFLPTPLQMAGASSSVSKLKKQLSLTFGRKSSREEQYADKTTDGVADDSGRWQEPRRCMRTHPHLLPYLYMYVKIAFATPPRRTVTHHCTKNTHTHTHTRTHKHAHVHTHTQHTHTHMHTHTRTRTHNTSDAHTQGEPNQGGIACMLAGQI